MEGSTTTNYLSKKELLSEIHKSKNTYSEYTDPKYADYDLIVAAKNYDIGNEAKCSSAAILPQCTKPDKVAKAKKTRANRLTQQKIEQYYKENGRDAPKPKIEKVKPGDILEKDLVFRVHTFEHVLQDIGRKKTIKTVADIHERINFFPYKHFAYNKRGKLVEVGRSHWKDGKYSSDHGQITPKLAHMFVMLVNRYSQRSNWRGYTYIDEMKGQAMLQLASMGLKFNEYMSDNPFAYYTASVTNAFRRVLNTEKKNQNIRDDLLEMNGLNPSFTRQLENDQFVSSGGDYHSDSDH